jgi:hypothetical protein
VADQNEPLDATVTQARDSAQRIIHERPIVSEQRYVARAISDPVIVEAEGVVSLLRQATAETHSHPIATNGRTLPAAT